MRRDGATAHALQVARHNWRAFIDAEVVDCEEGSAHWNFPKLHLMLHFRHQVHHFGCLGQWSTEIGESLHCRQVKDGYNAGNRTGDVYLQIINHYLRLDAFTVRELNFKAWRAAHSPTVSPAAPTVSPAAPPPRMRFVSLQFTSGPDRVSTFGWVFARMWSDELRAAIHHATRRFLHAHCVDLSDDDLLACPVAIYHSVQLDAEDMHGRSVRQRIRCTGDRTCYGKPPRRDWVWCRVGAEPLTASSPLPYKALQGRLPYRLLRLFKVVVPGARGADGQTFWLAFVEVTRASVPAYPRLCPSLCVWRAPRLARHMLS
jgi:hypothetical protein